MDHTLHPGDDQPPAESGGTGASDGILASDARPRPAVRRRSRYLPDEDGDRGGPADRNRQSRSQRPRPRRVRGRKPPRRSQRLRRPRRPAPRHAQPEADAPPRETRRLRAAGNGGQGNEPGRRRTSIKAVATTRITSRRASATNGSGASTGWAARAVPVVPAATSIRRSRRRPNFAPVFGDLPDPARFADLAALDAMAAELASGEGRAGQS